MPVLTITAVLENPWNVVTQELPKDCEPLLLELAYLAADYCCKSQYLTANAVRQGEYLPPDWRPAPGNCDAHERNEGRGEAAENKLREIIQRGGTELHLFINKAHGKIDV